VPNAFYDADGDGKTDIGVYRPGANVGFPSFFYTLRSFDNGFTSQQFGSGGDLIVTGDYNGDHVPDLGVWRVSNGLWYVADPVGDPAINFTGIQWGLPTDKPESGDYDGDGSRDLAVVRDQVMSGKPAVDTPAIWYIRNSLGGDLFAQQWDRPRTSLFRLITTVTAAQICGLPKRRLVHQRLPNVSDTLLQFWPRIGHPDAGRLRWGRYC
jgi:hypothetical protein